MDRQLSLEFARITEQAALKSARLVGLGDKEGADQAAVDGMHEQFALTPVSGTMVIGEGEIDEAPMLYIGEHVGQGGYCGGSCRRNKPCSKRKKWCYCCSCYRS